MEHKDATSDSKYPYKHTAARPYQQAGPLKICPVLCCSTGLHPPRKPRLD